MNHKLIKNALIAEKLYKLTPEEKKEAICELLKNNTNRGLAKELGIPHSTIHDWKSGRQKHKGKDIHISLYAFYRKISDSKPEDIKDWGRLEMIQERIQELIRLKG